MATTLEMPAGTLMLPQPTTVPGPDGAVVSDDVGFAEPPVDPRFGPGVEAAVEPGNEPPPHPRTPAARMANDRIADQRVGRERPQRPCIRQLLPAVETEATVWELAATTAQPTDYRLSLRWATPST
jgi:hypothetical protein